MARRRYPWRKPRQELSAVPRPQLRRSDMFGWPRTAFETDPSARFGSKDPTLGGSAEAQHLSASLLPGLVPKPAIEPHEQNCCCSALIQGFGDMAALVDSALRRNPLVSWLSAHSLR